MKLKNNMKKIVIASLYLHSQILFGDESTYMNSTQTNILNNELAYEQCQMIDQSYTVFENGQRVQKTRQIQDPACVARNNAKSKTRAVANEGLQRANAINSGNSEGLLKPTPPADPQCGSQNDTVTGEYNASYYQCMQNYNNQYREYQRQLTSYNQAMESQQQSQQNADKAQQDAIAKMNDSSATGSMSEIQAKNNKGKQMYTLAAAVAAGIAVTWYTNSAACFSTCAAFGSGCCSLAPGMMATGVAYMLLNGMANKQSSQHAQSALSACTAYNQMSTDKKDCSQDGQSPAVTVSSIDPNTGQCKPDAPPECQQGLNQAGVKIPVTKDANGKVNKMAGAEINKMATMLPDGRVKDKNGKIWSLSDFADKKSMMAAGLSSADAGKIFDELYGKNGALAKNGLLSAKDALKEDSKKSSFGGLGLSSGGTNVVDVNKSEGSQNKVFKDNLKEVENRKPSSEGLAREYKGEMIGVAGDDIFLMMNKRYKFKNEQDSFISAEAAH